MSGRTEWLGRELREKKREEEREFKGMVRRVVDDMAAEKVEGNTCLGDAEILLTCVAGAIWIRR